MNVLLIGGAGSLIDKMIIKLRKEGHRVYLITGNKYHREHYEKVFEQYYFDYDSENLTEVIDSVDPDVTVYMGAYDSNFSWREEQKESVRFSSGMMNILMAYSMVHKGRFIFLSSQDVFGKNYEEDIKEDTPLFANGFKGIALAQAEELCENYRKNLDLDIKILRLEWVYTIPKDRKSIDNICAEMCLKAMETGYIIVNGESEISMLYESDAVEFVYRVIRTKKMRHHIYHLSSAQAVSEAELADLVKQYMGEEINVVLEESDMGRVVLSNKRFSVEFGVSVFANLEQIVKKMAGYMLHHKELFVSGDDAGKSAWQKFKEKTVWFVSAAIPFLENIICFVPFFMLNNRAVGSAYFHNLDFYLLYVLLFAIVYGQQQATFSAILAVAGYLFREMYDRSSFAVMLDYNTYVWIAQLFILGLVVGYMRDELRIVKAENEEERRYLNRQLGDILDINSSNVRVKDVLKRQVIDQRDSVGKIYNITSALDQYMPEEVLFYAVDMIAQIMDCPDVAIYNVFNDTYARMFSASSKKARQLGNSIRYREMEEVYDEISQRKVYINRQLDERYPLMANAIYDNDEMQMIIMVWGIPWERMTLGQANLLTVVSYLIQNAVLRANRYINALQDERYVEGTKILHTEAFTSLVRAYRKAASRNLTECTILQLKIEQEQFEKAGYELAAKLRQTDYQGELADGRMYILLANTSHDDAQTVRKRFAEAGYESEIIELDDKLPLSQGK